ncbi:ABC transporter permease [Ohtaekwangia koreensis]|uniref:Putative ABC transport system permease protein n=1 Tax=Ohtaekwangia koreensis TaxID=688867 RepID=A0A1T5MHA2_9BACT|nr:ABC transporter permease [Ohtaekwangia koreensis]SKC87259.1 putative ABC transport system permease protein [Ohtaekwangia koreensis]
MFKNYLTLAIRNLLKRKLYSFINIAGLAIGVAVCLVILKYVDFELSYDNYHNNASNVYRTVTATYTNGEHRGAGPLSGYAQGPLLVADIPEVKTYARTHPMYGGAVVSNNTGAVEPLTFHEENIQFVDSTFFDVFTYNALSGNLATALDKPNSIVVTKTMAKKYFNTEDIVGKPLTISGGWADGDYEVTAVIDDVPDNSHFTFDFLLSFQNIMQNGQYKNDNGWGWYNFVTYVELQPHADPKEVEKKLPAFIEKYQGKDLAQSNSRQVLTFQPIRDIHLTPGFNNESSATMSVNSIYFFIIISIFILAIAWVNYINLSTARAIERAREVGIKKAIGAFRTQLISQFIFESVLVNFIGIVLAVLLSILLLPVLGDIVDKDLVFDFTDGRLWGVLLSLFVVGSLVSGAYPAFVLSSFNTTAVLKGGADKVTGGFSLRKVLVVFQFVASLILIAGTFAIYRQLVFMRSQDKGFNMEQMLIFNGPSVITNRETVEEKLITLKNEIKKIASVENVTTSASIPGGGFNWGTGMRKDGSEQSESKSGNVAWVDPDFLATYGMELVSGRSWDANRESDKGAMLVNEAALKAFGLGDARHALEERIILGDDTVDIIGVLKNYHWNSLKSEHIPILLASDKVSRRNYSVRLSGNIQESIKQIEAKYKEVFPGNPFDYYFLDDFFDKQYKDDQQFGKIFSLFAGLAIVIACLGLWGLASFTTTQKLREISIRKVLGASTSSIMSLLSSQFMKLVFIAAIIAIPITWYGIDRWLDSFAFHIDITWDLFVVPGVILAIIALATVSVHIFRGAGANPAKVLRSE